MAVIHRHAWPDGWLAVIPSHRMEDYCALFLRSTSLKI
jgi:hypothetical protein